MVNISDKPTAKTPPEGRVEARSVVPSWGYAPFEDFDKFFDEMFPRTWLRPFRFERPLLPRTPLPMMGKTVLVDVIDRPDEILVKAELPGVEKKDIDVSLTDHTVMLKADTKAEYSKEEGDYFRCEISRGMYARTIELPATIITEKAKATYKDGLLELVLPKKEKEHKVTVKIA